MSSFIKTGVFLLFVVLCIVHQGISLSCYECEGSTDSGGNQENCLNTNNETRIVDNCIICQEVMMQDGYGNNIRTIRSCQRDSSATPGVNCSEGITNDPHICECYTDECNKKLKLEHVCYACGYTTNGRDIKANVIERHVNGTDHKKVYESNKNCLVPGKHTHVTHCNGKCFEFAKNQSFPNDEYVGIIVRDCLANFESIPNTKTTGTNRTCMTDRCNSKFTSAYQKAPKDSASTYSFWLSLMIAFVFVLIGLFDKQQ